MKRKLFKISLYWKCQVLGWGFFTLLWLIIPFMYNGTNTGDLLTAIMLFISGICCTHIMKVTIKKWKIIYQPLHRQILYLLLLTILFSILLVFLDHILAYRMKFINLYLNMSSRRFLEFVIREIIFTSAVVFIWSLIYFLYQYIKNLRKEIQSGANMKIELLELEAKALRAQMNPHFIFNSLNSIKSLIQQNENEKSVTYLTTFSKLIRTLLNNADKKEISLYDEIETCKLYLQLEAMRFDTKFSYAVNVNKDIDLKSIQLPALIIQPFIENAIWHGIVPRNSTGHVSLTVVRKEGVIEVIIEDDGIGRAASQQNKSTTRLTHQSKGVNLTQTRLELNNLLQQRQAELVVIDKKDERGIATGTTVIIKIKEELS